jgi:diguanylate cyclase (GGDEF)-like protein
MMLEKNEKLREKAYEIIKRKGNEFSSKFEKSDLQTLLHELDVYQAELEAQNEELRNKENDLIIANEKNQKLFDEAPFPYLLLDNSFVVKEANFLAQDFFNFTKSKRKTIIFSSFIKEGGMKLFLDWIVSNEYKNNYLELDLISFSKRPNRFRLYLKDYGEKKEGFLLTLRDVQVEVNLAEDLNRKNLLLNEITQNQENLIMVYDNNYKLIFLNDRFLEFYSSKDISEFKTKYSSIDCTFIKNEGFFSVDTKIDLHWTDIMINSDLKDNLVLLKEKKTDNVKAFIVSISRSKTDNIICSLSEVTNISLEKRKLEKRVFYDELTQIYNRAKFNDFLNTEFPFFKRQSLDLSIVMFDIDFFKDINDNYGHDVGDEVLKYLSEIVSTRLRESDIFARWGGEEFIILLKACSKEDACSFAQNLKSNIEEAIFPHEIKMTCSFGVTTILPEDSIKTFLKRVDELLYLSKRNGRNRVSC